MVNPRDIAGNTEVEEEKMPYGHASSYDSSNTSVCVNIYRK